MMSEHEILWNIQSERIGDKGITSLPGGRPSRLVMMQRGRVANREMVHQERRKERAYHERYRGV
jgi:hypothetical protein